MNRRTFVGAAVALVTSAAAGVWWFVRGRPVDSTDAAGQTESSADSSADSHEGHQHASGSPMSTPKARFPARYEASLKAMINQLMPEAEGMAGAESTGAWEYIHRALGRDDMQSPFRLAMRGAAVIDQISSRRFSKPFVGLESGQRDEVIQALLDGEGAKPDLFEPPLFVEQMLALTMEGMYGDPMYGGNREQKGWETLGYIMHPPRPSCGH